MVLKKSNGEKSELRISSSRLIVAKVIAFSVFCLGVLFVITEIMTMCMYGIPYILTEIARNVGVQAGADWVVGGILWAFPALFITIILALLHFFAAKKIIVKLWKWMISVMKKSVEDKSA